MSYSYQKQIERLLRFVKDVQETQLECYCQYSNKHDVTCLWHRAQQLLNDEPIRWHWTTENAIKEATVYGLLETPREHKAPERKYNYPRYF
jgi:hypothetical protein